MDKCVKVIYMTMYPTVRLYVYPRTSYRRSGYNSGRNKPIGSPSDGPWVVPHQDAMTEEEVFSLVEKPRAAIVRVGTKLKLRDKPSDTILKNQIETVSLS